MKPLVVNITKTKRFDVYIGRPGPYGNPFIIGPHGTRDEVCDRHEALVRADPKLMAKIKRELKGKVLGCYCAPLRCHGDTLVTIANEP